MTPKIRLSPRASSARTPPKSTPLMTASRRKMSTLQPHVGAPHHVALQQFGGRPGQGYMAGLEKIGAIDQLQRLLDVLLDDQHGKTLLANPPHQVEDLLDDQ